jgi:ubiquinone/menaquinone biosynthesis C-methylase UbiE
MPSNVSAADPAVLFTRRTKSYVRFIRVVRYQEGLRSYFLCSPLLCSGLRVLDAGRGPGALTFALRDALLQRSMTPGLIQEFDVTSAMLEGFQERLTTDDVEGADGWVKTLSPKDTNMEAHQVHDAMRRRYAAVAERATGQFNYPVGRESAERLNYRHDLLDRIPPDVVAHFVGVGNPFSMGEPEPGWNVLDIGCGCGLDSQAAAMYVGPTGRVRAVDLSSEMLKVAQTGLHLSGLTNVEFTEGTAEALPLDSNWADLVISNGVFNLAFCKQSAFAELARVLKPGGRFQAADLILVKKLPEELEDDQFAWSN